MDGCPMFSRERRDARQPLSYGVITDGRNAIMRANVMLTDQVSDPQSRFNLHKLYLPQFKRRVSLDAMPRAIPSLRLPPPLRHGHDKAPSPSTHIVADVDKDARPFGNGLGCVSDGIS